MFDAIIDAIFLEIEQDMLSEAEMARRLHVPQSSLHRVLHQKRRLGLDLLGKILAARPQWRELLNGDGPGSPCNH